MGVQTSLFRDMQGHFVWGLNPYFETQLPSGALFFHFFSEGFPLKVNQKRDAVSFLPMEIRWASTNTQVLSPCQVELTDGAFAHRKGALLRCDPATRKNWMDGPNCLQREPKGPPDTTVYYHFVLPLFLFLESGWGGGGFCFLVGRGGEREGDGPIPKTRHTHLSGSL